MNEASQPSQQNTIIEEIKHRVLEVDALRNGTKHPEEIELPLDYIAALDEITTIEREEIEDIARDVIAKHKNISRIIPQKRQKNKQRDMNQWLINISLLLIVSVAVKVLFLDDGSPKDPNEKSFATRIASTDFNALQQDASDVFSDVAHAVETLTPSLDAIPDLPFTLDDMQDSAASTFSSIVQSTQDLFLDDERASSESAEVSANQLIAVEVSSLEGPAIQESVSTITTLTDVITATDALALSNSPADSDEIGPTADAQQVVALENTQPAEIDVATLEAANKAIENSMTKGTTIAEELEKVDLIDTQEYAKVIANLGSTNSIELTENVELAESLMITTKHADTFVQSKLEVKPDEIQPLVSDNVSNQIAQTTQVHSDDSKTIQPETLESVSIQTNGTEPIKITSAEPVIESTTLVAAQIQSAKNLDNDSSTPIEKQASEIASTASDSDISEVSEEYLTSRMIPETGLLTALKHAFGQLANIKDLPSSHTVLANDSVIEKTSADETEITEVAEIIETSIAASNMSSEDVMNHNAINSDVITSDVITSDVINSDVINIDPEAVTPVDIVTAKVVDVQVQVDEEIVKKAEIANVAENIEVANISLLEVTDTATLSESPSAAQTVALVEPQVVEEASIATVGNSRPISTAPMEQWITETPALSEVNTQELPSNGKVTTKADIYSPETTIAARPISTEPEVFADSSATSAAEKTPMVAAEKTTITITETARSKQPQSGTQVLRVTLGSDDAIDEVTEKIIAAQQAPQSSSTADDNINSAFVVAASKPAASTQTAQTAQTATKINAPTPAKGASYNGLNLKLQLNSIVDLSQLAKMSVADFYSYQARLPKPADKIDLPINDLKAHPLISDIFLSEQSDVVVKLAKYYGEGSQLTFTPSIASDGKFINWECNANIDPTLLTGPGESPCQLSKSAALPAVNTKL
ncbi:hypothetical protein ORI98_10670 [Shewanella sp. ULN5]|uniref:hypothetical protein n=1 Tax=Shewanella sp. ULN5 TaxID=2994678 RepID=UPI00273E3FA1|nr:hypothetical protein [Shewanella sp. ULN5]MDP5146898.1 hypothetical protein [Shewanella sp. ULN5]